MRPIIVTIAVGLVLSSSVLTMPLRGQEAADASELADIVAARKGLMQQIDVLMAEIEFTIAEPGEDAALRASQLAGLLSPAFRAFPHLFPDASSTEALTAAGIEVQTSAAPAIWEDFETFHTMAQTARERADAIFTAQTLDEIGPLAEELRQSCEACHAQFLFYDPFAAMGAEALPPGIE